MAYGRRDGFSYADGVPLKLNDRLQPPPQFVFAPPIINTPDLLQNEYNFIVERGAIEQYLQHKRAKEAQEKAKVDKVAHDIEQFAQIPLDTGQGAPKQDTVQLPSIADHVIVNNLRPTPKNVNGELKTEGGSVLPAWQSALVLNPQPLVKDVPTNMKQISTKQFNLTDFENQGSSPFDTVELQTLNDLEELNTVFQGIAVTTSIRNDQPKIPYPDGYAKTVAQPINGYQIHPDVKQYQRYAENVKPQCYYNGYHMYGSPSASEHLSSTLRTDKDELMFPRLKGSKSTPDIRDEISQQTNWNRSQTPPPYAQSQTTVSIERRPEVTSWHQHQHPPPVSRSTRSTSLSLPTEGSIVPPVAAVGSGTPPSQQQQAERPVVSECLPNPYHELEESKQLFAATIAQMGFNLDRVARTVKHLGTDDKKVVDHLCCVQRLEEAGYEGNDAETALHLYDYNFQEAKRFLDLLKQFQDLGFQKNDARKALIRHKNDRDRALDSLLS